MFLHLSPQEYGGIGFFFSAALRNGHSEGDTLTFQLHASSQFSIAGTLRDLLCEGWFMLQAEFLEKLKLKTDLCVVYGSAANQSKGKDLTFSLTRKIGNVCPDVCTACTGSSA